MDTTLTIERTIHALENRFGGQINLSDLAPSTSAEARRSSELSRALAALSIMALSEADTKAAVDSITDGYDDLGLDAIYFDSIEKTLYVVQSKWSEKGQKTIELGDCLKFLAGMRSLIHADFSKANDRLKKREKEIHEILIRPDVKITMVLVHTGTSQLGDQIVNALDEFLKEQNNVGEADVVTREIFDLKRVYANLDPTAAKKINITIGLSEWGRVAEPFRAYYGQVKLSDVANWAHHGKFLFDKNLRFYRGTTEVNDAMDDTLTLAPDHFWYFNNGITILCDAIVKAPLNAEDNSWGVFECAGVSVVNGAQTAGVIWERARQQSDFFAGSNARVHLRIVSLENCPPGFGRELTRATNTQNEIRHRDFAALDDNQRIIAREMELDGRRYAYKSGDIDPKESEGCTIEEATIALACAAGDITMAVAAKRELGSLWRDINRQPYTTIFNEKTRARDVWRAVLVARAAQVALDRLDLSAFDRGDQIAVHGNRFILHLVFEDPEMRDYKNASVSDEAIEARASSVAERAFRRIADAVNKKHSNAYLQPLFKNAQKCRDLFLPPEEEGQIQMFEC